MKNNYFGTERKWRFDFENEASKELSIDILRKDVEDNRKSIDNWLQAIKKLTSFQTNEDEHILDQIFRFL